MKHIESILPENVADELSRLLLDDATVLSALKDLLHRATGCEIPLSNDVTTSEIEDMIPLCLSILRGFWNTPLTALGDNTNKRSLADTFYNAIGSRVQGNTALGIPDANYFIAEAVKSLSNRRIDCSNVPDGISLANLLWSNHASQVIEIADNNVGWWIEPNKLSSSINTFTNLRKLTLQCIGTLELSTIQNLAYLEELSIPFIEGANVSSAGADSATGATGCIRNLTALKKLYAPKLSNATWGGNGNQYSAVITGCPELQEIWLGIVTNTNYAGWGDTKWVIQYCENLQYLHVERFVTNNCTVRSGQNNNLVLIEICKKQEESCNLNWWSPTTALSERLDEFLSNFQLYIADRVADMTGKTALTLTLSAAVYEALQAQEGQTILATLTNKNWTVAQA